MVRKCVWLSRLSPPCPRNSPLPRLGVGDVQIPYLMTRRDPPRASGVLLGASGVAEAVAYARILGEARSAWLRCVSGVLDLNVDVTRVGRRRSKV